MRLHSHNGRSIRHFWIGHEHSAARGQISENWICYVQPVLHDQVHVPVESVVAIEIEEIERFRPGNRIVAVVQPHSEHRIAVVLDTISDVDDKLKKSARMLTDLFAVEVNI